MNVKLLRKVSKHISEEPQRFIMGEGIVFGGEAYDSCSDLTVHPPCGTAGCIAGTACVVSKEVPKTEERIVAWHDVQQTALRLLKISPEQGERLFRLEEWPEKFEDGFHGAESQKERAAVAVARIEHFIKTKGAE